MTAIDQAFIRAYETDDVLDTSEVSSSGVADLGVTGRNAPSRDSAGMPVSLPMPHVVFPPAADFSATASGKTFGVAASIAVADQVVDQNMVATDATAANASPPERRPLSAFAPPEQTSPDTFKPALEVDGFRWSAVCDRLTRQHATVLAPVIEQLLVAAESGRSLVGFLGAEPAAGCTTLLLCTARLLAAAGKSVVVVDGDFATTDGGNHAKLAGQLGLAVATGWEDVLAGRVPLAEGVVRSLGDGIAVLPLARGPNPTGNAIADVVQGNGIQASVTAGVLRYHFDVVLFDLGCVANEQQAAATRAITQHCRLDTMLVVASSATSTQSLEQAVGIVAATETDCLGLIENQAKGADQPL